MVYLALIRYLVKSLSARRAWIEILLRVWLICLMLVALRKESVDRNQTTEVSFFHVLMSLSARRAWIEISDILSETLSNMVALRKESVDRNLLSP